MPERTLLLTNDQILQKINRIAYQIYENNYDEKEVVIAGIDIRGYQLAEKISSKLNEISSLRITLLKLSPDRQNLFSGQLNVSPDHDCKDKVVVVVDDVLNTGNTLIHCLKHFLGFPLKKLSTAVLVDRNHKDFPVKVDFIGLKVSTTMQDHILVEFKSDGRTEAYLV